MAIKIKEKRKKKGKKTKSNLFNILCLDNICRGAIGSWEGASQRALFDSLDIK